MAHNKDDPKGTFILVLILLLGIIGIILVSILVFFHQGRQMVEVLLSLGFVFSTVLAVALGYNIFARVRGSDGRSGELKAQTPDKD